MNVNEMGGQDAEHLAQVRYPESCKGCKTHKIYDFRMDKGSQSCITLAFLTPSEVQARQGCRIIIF